MDGIVVEKQDFVTNMRILVFREVGVLYQKVGNVVVEQIDGPVLLAQIAVVGQIVLNNNHRNSVFKLVGQQVQRKYVISVEDSVYVQVVVEDLIDNMFDSLHLVGRVGTLFVERLGGLNSLGYCRRKVV